jgi:hypothetical protein
LCRSGIGFGFKSLAARYKVAPAQARASLLYSGKWTPSKVRAGKRGKGSKWNPNDLIMEHYRDEEIAASRWGIMTTYQVIHYYMNTNYREESKRRAKERWHKVLKNDRSHILKKAIRLKAWKLKNKARHKQTSAAWRRDNKQRLRGYRKKRNSNPLYRVTNSLRRRVRDYIKGVSFGGCEGLTWLTHEKLRRYIERQFTGGMSWENYGTAWHIDHTVPCAMFDLTSPDNVRKCFNYKNLKPMPSEANLNKGSLLFTDCGTLPLRVGSPTRKLSLT